MSTYNHHKRSNSSDSESSFLSDSSISSTSYSSYSFEDILNETQNNNNTNNNTDTTNTINNNAKDNNIWESCRRTITVDKNTINSLSPATTAVSTNTNFYERNNNGKLYFPLHNNNVEYDYTFNPFSQYSTIQEASSSAAAAAATEEGEGATEEEEKEEQLHSWNKNVHHRDSIVKEWSTDFVDTENQCTFDFRVEESENNCTPEIYHHTTQQVDWLERTYSPLCFNTDMELVTQYCGVFPNTDTTETEHKTYKMCFNWNDPEDSQMVETKSAEHTMPNEMFSFFSPNVSPVEPLTPPPPPPFPPLPLFTMSYCPPISTTNEEESETQEEEEEEWETQEEEEEEEWETREEEEEEECETQEEEEEEEEESETQEVGEEESETQEQEEEEESETQEEEGEEESETQEEEEEDESETQEDNQQQKDETICKVLEKFLVKKSQVHQELMKEMVHTVNRTHEHRRRQKVMGELLTSVPRLENVQKRQSWTSYFSSFIW